MTPASDWFETLPKHRLMAEYSLWSADLLRIGPDMDRVDRHVDLYHRGRGDRRAVRCFTA